MASVACIGEGMIEFSPAHDLLGCLYSRGFGGDTLNTAVYLARLDVNVDYLTALGDDALSDEMITAWTAEGVGTRRVVRLPGKLPGIYMIQAGAQGERRFFHWRENSAARRLMDVPETDELLNSLMSYDIVYFSAITLSIFDSQLQISDLLLPSGIFIYDISGKLLTETTATGPSAIIPFPQKGIFIVKIQNEAQTLTQKIMSR